MSDETIRVGDLVMIKQVCCDLKAYGLGMIFKVERIESYDDYGTRCCGPLMNGSMIAYGCLSGRSGYHPIPWLRKIPPLSEPETTETREDIHEPA